MATVTSSKRQLTHTSNTYESNGDVTIGGNLNINGTTTTIDTANLLVEDKNIIIGDVSSPSDSTADGGGITLKGTTDKTLIWVDSTDAWTFNQNVNASGYIHTDSNLSATGNLETNGTFTLHTISAQNSENTALVINGSGVVGTRELGSNAFNSTSFLTSYTETDTLATVTGRGATTSQAITISNQLSLNNGVGNGSGPCLTVGGSGDIQATTGGSLFFGAYNYGASTYIRGHDSSTGLQFFSNGSNVMNITSSTVNATSLNMSGNIAMGDNDVTGIDELVYTSGNRLKDDGSYIQLKYANTTSGGLQVRDGDNAVQGYLYADGASTPNFGLLDGTGSWAVKCRSNEYVQLLYDNAAKLQTASTGVTVTGVISATGGNSTNWNTAHGWGDHSGAGYLTSSSTQSKYLRSDASDSFSGKLTGTATNENLEVGGIRGTAKGSQTGDYIHLYERVHIGGPSGWGHSTHGAPSNGLSVWGAIDLGMGGSGALQVDGTTVLTNARVLQNVTAAAGIITSGTFADARIASASNWNTAYTDRNKWDGGSTGLTAATGRTSLGLGSAATQNTSAFATASHNHDDRYYTETETNGFLNLKANLNGATFTGDVTVGGILKDGEYHNAGSANWKTKKYIRSVGVTGADIQGVWVYLARVVLDGGYEKARIKFNINSYDDVASGVEAIDVSYENHSTGQEHHILNWYTTDNNAATFSEVRSIRSSSSGLSNTYDLYVQMSGDWRDTFTVVAESWVTHGSSTPITFPTSAGSSTAPTAGSDDKAATSREWYTSNSQMYSGSNKFWHAGNDGSGSGLDADTVDGVHASSFLRSDASDSYAGDLSVNGMTFRDDSNLPKNFRIQPTATSTDVGLSMYLGNGTHSIQLYGTSSQYGFLDGNWANWDIKKTRNGAFEVDEGSGLQRVFNAGYHPNADTLTNARTITLAGDVTGNVSFNGSSDVSITTVVGNDSHTHTKLAGFSNQTEYDLIRAGNLNGLYMKARWDGSTSNRYWDMGYVDGYGTFYSGLKVINNGDITYKGNEMWHAGNDGTGTGLDADLLDAQEGSYYRNATNLNAGTVAADRLSTASTQPPNDNSTKIATTAYVQTELTDLIGAAPAALDTLSELADAINDDSTFSSTVTTALGNRLRVDTASQGLNSTQKSNARTNLGLGTAATSASTAFAPAAGSTSIVSLGTVVAGDWNAGVISSTYLDADTAHLSGTQTFSGAKTFSSTGNTFNGHHYFSAYNSAGNHYPHYMHGSTGGAKVNVRVYNTGGGSADVLYFAAGDNNMTWRGNKIWNAGNDGAGTGLDADLLDGNHASAFMGSSGMAANTDVYMNFRVLRNSNSSSANDGMYIGYGNSNSGQTRIFGGGSTGVHLAINATNMAFNNNAVWHAGNDGSGSGLDADKLDGVDGVVLAQSLRAGLNVTGGGTITVDASYYIKNSSRFIVISAGRGSNFATDGYFDIDIPTSGTITGVGGASNKTATSNGIPLASWEALYYILPLGSAATSQAANFKVVRYTSGFDIPYNWVLLAVRNSDGTNQVSILGGKYILGAGQSINTQSYNSRRIEFADKLTTARTIAGTSFNGSANIDISYNDLTNKPTIPSLSGYATQSYVGTQISNLIDSSPAALNTLNELAAALGDDANFSTTITDSIATKAPLASPTFTGAVTLSGSIQNNNQATSIDLKDHSNYTWFRNAANRWVFQGGADGDDWTQHFALKLETVGTGYNDKYAELGQQQNNGSNGGRYKGVRIVKSTGSSSVVDGELKAGDGVFSGSVTGSNLNISNWNTAHGWGNHASAGYVTSSGNTIIGTDSDIDTSGATVIDQLNMTDGVIQSHSTRTLTLANLGYTGATNANNYSLPEATATARGGIELFSNTDQSVAANSVSATSGRTYGIQLNSAGQAVVNVPWSDTNTDTNTTYSAGNGISLSSTTFSVAAGGGLTQTSTGLSHSDTSSQASVNNSSGTVIQDITLDTYGHITAISSANLDGRYYTETETNSFLNLKANLNGATFTGDLTVSKTSPLIRIYDSNTGSGSYPALEFDTANNQGVAIEFNEFDGELPAGGYGLIIKESSTNAQFPTTGTLSLSVLGEIYAGSTSIGSVNRVFHDGYHPNADTLTTARTINGVSFNGSSNITVADSTKLPLSGGTVTGNVTFNSNINVGERVTHNGDSNTWMGMTTDQINFYAGNVKMLTLQEGTHDQIVINENGGDVNFRIESDLESNAFYIDGAGNGSVGILTTTPTATLDVDGTIEHKVYTVSTLPSASPAGKRAFVSDAYYDLASSHGSTFPGGGSYTIPCYSDGSNWRAG